MIPIDFGGLFYGGIFIGVCVAVALGLIGWGAYELVLSHIQITWVD